MPIILNTILKYLPHDHIKHHPTCNLIDTFLYLIRITKTLGNNSAQALKVVVNSNISIVVKKLV